MIFISWPAEKKMNLFYFFALQRRTFFCSHSSFCDIYSLPLFLQLTKYLHLNLQTFHDLQDLQYLRCCCPRKHGSQHMWWFPELLLFFFWLEQVLILMNRAGNRMNRLYVRVNQILTTRRAEYSCYGKDILNSQ